MNITKWTFLFLLISYWSQAQVLTGAIEDLPFVTEKISGLNDIQLLTTSKEIESVEYSLDVCHPIGMDKTTKVYSLMDFPNRGVSYIRHLTLKAKDKEKKIEMKINGHHVIGYRNKPLRFKLDGNCTKFLPVSFISAADQKYMGVDIKKENEVTDFINNNNYMAIGQITSDGYLNAPWLDSDSDKLKDYEYAKKVLNPVGECAEVKKTRDSSEGFYIFEGKKIGYDVSRPNFWKARSKYFGHVLCSDQPKAIVECKGALLNPEDIDDIFGLNKIGALQMINGDERELKNYEKNLKRAIVLGKKCDEVIAKYEKETGKKVKSSPFYPGDGIEEEAKTKENSN